MQRMRIASGLALVLAVSATATAYGSESTSKIPDGIYRANVTGTSLQAAGVDARSAHWNSGIQTLIFRGKRFTTWAVRGSYHAPRCSGDLSYSGARVTLKADRGPQCGTASGGLLFSARWSFMLGQLRFTVVRAQPDDSVPAPLFGGRPWRKIG